ASADNFFGEGLAHVQLLCTPKHLQIANPIAFSCKMSTNDVRGSERLREKYIGSRKQMRTPSDSTQKQINTKGEPLLVCIKQQSTIWSR
ncbi:MAG: hypothetical protein V1926_03515, partial [Candidatus Peregrinibacteria bacterium]